MAEEGQTHVVPEDLYLPAAHGPRGWVNCNLRTTFEKIVRRAGLEPWPRLFHALRASCETDLAREYPITTACRWIGNTVAVASRHYVQVTEEDFRRASGAAQNPAQSEAEPGCKALTRKHDTLAFPEEYEGVRCGTNVQMEAAGIEPASITAYPSRGCEESPTPTGTESGTVGARNPTPADPPADPDLAEVVARWATLPGATRQGILRLARGLAPT